MGNTAVLTILGHFKITCFFLESVLKVLGAFFHNPSRKRFLLLFQCENITQYDAAPKQSGDKVLIIVFDKTSLFRVFTFGLEHFVFTAPFP